MVYIESLLYRSNSPPTILQGSSYRPTRDLTKLPAKSHHFNTNSAKTHSGAQRKLTMNSSQQNDDTLPKSRSYVDEQL